MKKIIALVLSIVTVFSLAACGKTESGSAAPSAASSGKAEATPVPEKVWVSEYNSLKEDSEAYLTPSVFTSEGFYASASEKAGTREAYRGESVSYEGQLDVFESKLYFVGFDGTVKPLSAFVPTPVPEFPEGEDVYPDFTGSYVTGMRLNDDGTLSVIETVYLSWWDQPIDYTNSDFEDHMFNDNHYVLRTLDADGSEISSYEFTLNDDEWAGSVVFDENGNLLVTGSNGLRALDSEGNEAYSVSVDGYVDSLMVMNDGRVAAFISGNSGEQLSYLSGGKLSDPINLPNNVWSYYCYPGDDVWPMYYTNGQYFCGFNPDTGDNEKLFNWLDCDVNPDSIGSLGIKNGCLYIPMTEYDSKTEAYDSSLITVKEVPYENAPHKQEITLATLGLEWNVQAAVIQFNRKNDSARIKVLDYSQYNTEEDYSAGLTKLTTEILAGNMPDILDLSNLPKDQLASKGLLEDLLPWIDSDPEIDRSDFFENVLDAAMNNGKLYTTVSTFYVNTVIGASSVVGDEIGWTYEEFEEALSNMPEGCTPFDEYTTRDTILQNCLALDMNEYVDWDTGRVDFDNEDFYSLLKFAAQFPEDLDWENMDYSDSSSKISQGLQMLQTTSVMSFDNLLYDFSTFGGNATYVGYPTNNGNGNMLFIENGFAVSADSANKEAAWSFLRTFFTKEYMENVWALPLSKSLYMEKRKEATTVEYKKDGDGNYLLDENGEKIPVAKYGFSTNGTDVQYFYGLTEEQAQKIDELVMETTKVYNFNDSIFDIVNEEAQAFFSGQKSVEEVARLIQSKANIYVNEQR